MTIELNTYQQKEIIDITDRVSQELEGNGLVNIFVKHTTAGISVADLDPGGDTDLINAITKLTPAANWIHPHDSDHYPDHFWSTLIGCSLSVPFENSRLILGKWQRIILVELDGPKTRQLLLTCIK